MVKGLQTGCGLHGYSLAFYPFSIGKSIYLLFFDSQSHLIPFQTKQQRNYRAFPHLFIVITHTHARMHTHTHTHIYIHIYISTHTIIVDCIHVHNTSHTLLLLLTIPCSRNKKFSTYHMLLLMLTVPMYGQLQTW